MAVRLYTFKIYLSLKPVSHFSAVQVRSTNKVVLSYVAIDAWQVYQFCNRILLPGSRINYVRIIRMYNYVYVSLLSLTNFISNLYVVAGLFMFHILCFYMRM